MSKEEFSQNVKTNVLSIAFPLPKEIWICLGISFIVVGATLSTTGFPLKRAIYWLASVMLEQGDNLQNIRKTSNVIVIFACMYMAIILRNVYTSTMFSNLIEMPEPKHIPESIYDLFSNSLNYKADITFVESSFKSKLVNRLHLVGNNTGYGVVHSDFVSGLVKHTRQIESWWNENHANSISEFQPIPCSKYPFKVIEKCDTSKRVGLVYKTMGDWENRDKEFRFIKTVVSLLGGRKYKEPSSQKIFMPDRMFWYFNEASYIIANFQLFVSAVEQSGIAQKVRINRDIAIQSNKLKEANEMLRNKTTWNFYAYSEQDSKKRSQRQNSGNALWKRMSKILYEPIQLENFAVILTLFGYMFSFNIVILLVELIIHKDYTRKSGTKLISKTSKARIK